MPVLYPEVGMKGALIALAPFDTVVVPKVQYECMAVESLAGILASGVNAYDLYYRPYGIDKVKYDLDIRDGVKLITLQSYQGQYLKVPHSYLNGTPDPSGVAYVMSGLSLTLSALPIDTDLNGLKSDLTSVVSSRLGVQCNIQEIIYGPVTLLSTDQDARIRAARSGVMNASAGLSVANAALRDENDALMQRIAMLEAYIKTHYVTP
jgi:hypothetical protein